jgi:hypothetical protein
MYQMNHEQAIVLVFSKHAKRKVYEAVVRVSDWSKRGLVELVGREQKVRKVLGNDKIALEEIEGGESCGLKTMGRDGDGTKISMIGRNN